MLQCDVVMTSSLISSLNNYIVEYSFLFPMVQKCNKFHQEVTGVIVKNKVAHFMAHGVEVRQTSESRPNSKQSSGRDPGFDGGVRSWVGVRSYKRTTVESESIISSGVTKAGAEGSCSRA